ncbi:MAG: hypothetical protein J3Q66DRAFT_436778 [Benniella sp.]|nr:MAG: hypothetical protein J3Q66DRAFT_436778 [Benniella sp.]
MLRALRHTYSPRTLSAPPSILQPQPTCQTEVTLIDPLEGTSSMRVLCNTSDIATSSRLTPSEEAELRSVTENTGFDVKIELSHEQAYKAMEVVESRKQSQIPSYKKCQSSQPNLTYTLVAVVDKGPAKVSGDSCQIQALAAMDDTELETLGTTSNIIRLGPRGPPIMASIIPQRLSQLEPYTDSSSNGNSNTDTTDIGILEPEKASSGDPSAPISAPLMPAFHPKQASSIVEAHIDLQQHQSSTTSLVLEAEGPPPSTATLNPDQFKTVFRELSKYTEQLESLNEQILDAMTHSTVSPTFTRVSQIFETKRKIRGKERAIHLEEDRDCVAQSFTDLIIDSWPWIHKAPPGPKTLQVTKFRIKMAKRLKDAIDNYWRVQCHFEDQAQLILDVYQDPMELKYGEKIRILKGQHLNNILVQDSIDSHYTQQLLEKYRYHHNKMEALLEQLQNVWLGIFMMLTDLDQRLATSMGHRIGISSMHLDGAASSSSSYHLSELKPRLGGGVEGCSI